MQAGIIAGDAKVLQETVIVSGSVHKASFSGRLFSVCNRLECVTLSFSAGSYYKEVAVFVNNHGKEKNSGYNKTANRWVALPLSRGIV